MPVQVKTATIDIIHMESITLSRQGLYNLVWTESMLALSKKYDISVVGLRKMCKRNDIPIPKGGHWMKIKYGKKSPRLKLPATTASKEKITLEIRTEKSEAEKAANQIVDDPIQEELEERRQKEVKGLIKLLVKFNRWQQTQQLREYLSELEKKAIYENNHTEEFQSWLKRAREKTDWLDPMIERKDEWLDCFDREKVITRANQKIDFK